MSYDEMTPAELRQQLRRQDEMIDLLRGHIADCEQRLASSDTQVQAALTLWGQLAPRFAQCHNDKGELPTEILAGIASDCWTAASIFVRTFPPARRPTPVGGPK